MEDPKVILEKRLLRDLGHDGAQRIALVYEGRREYRVYAPARAAGHPAQWYDQLAVHTSAGYGEVAFPEPDRSRIIEAVLRELDRSESEAVRAEVNALYRPAQICRQEHPQSVDGHAL
jgi:hypothetical protein